MRAAELHLLAFCDAKTQVCPLLSLVRCTASLWKMPRPRPKYSEGYRLVLEAAGARPVDMPTPSPAIAPARIPNKTNTAVFVRSDLLVFMGDLLFRAPDLSKAALDDLEMQSLDPMMAAKLRQSHNFGLDQTPKRVSRLISYPDLPTQFRTLFCYCKPRTIL